MKKRLRFLSVISMILAIIILIEIPIGAVAPVFGNKDLSEELILPESTIIQATQETNQIISEIEEERTEYTKTFKLNDGTFMVAQYPIPVHYKDNKGNWSDYDNSLSLTEQEVSVLETPFVTLNEATDDSVTPTPAPDTATADSVTPAPDTATNRKIEKKQMLKTQKGDSQISFAKETASENMVLVKNGDHTVSWGYKDINAKSAKQKNEKKARIGNDRYTVLDNLTSTVVYESAYDGVDIECITTPVGVKENIILNKKSSANKFVSTYDIGELRAEKINDREIALYNANDEIEYYINALYMFDANNIVSEDIVLNILENANGKLVIELIADEQWLNDAKREYPVVIDPSFIYKKDWNEIDGAYVYSGDPNEVYSLNAGGTYTGSLEVSTDDRYSLLKINQLPELNKGDMIVDVSVNLYMDNKDYHTNAYVGVYDVKDNWNQSTVTWNSKPKFGDVLIDYCDVYSVLRNGSVWASWDITKLAKEWYNGKDNNGIYFKMLPGSNNQIGRFLSPNYTNSSYRPYFIISYRNNKGIESYWNYTTVGVGSVGVAYVNDYSGALAFELPITSTADPVLPAGVSYIYNSYMANTKYDKTAPYFGNGWRMNMQQTLLPSSQYGLTGDDAATYPYVYTDLDGTEHYFYRKYESGVAKYYDEDGLNLELTINSSSSDKRYVITDEDKNKLYFYSTGLLNKFEDAYGNVQQVNYSGSTITNISDTTGNQITLNRNSNNYVTSVTDPSGRATGFTYDANNNITSITYPDTKVATISYGTNGLITEVIDRDGSKVQFGYNSFNQVTSITEYGKGNKLGQQITFDRTKLNETKVYTNGVDGQNNTSDDLIITYQFDNWGRTVSTQTSTKDNTDMGATNTTYTSGNVNSNGTNIKKINKITTGHALGANAINLLKNSNLEGTSNWANGTLSGTASATVAENSTTKYYGHKSLYLENTACTSDGASSIYQDVSNLSSNTTYTFSAYVKVDSITAQSTENFGAVACATVYNSDGTTTDHFSEYISETTDTTVNNGWRRVSVTFTTPDNFSKVRVHLALKSATGKVYFDGTQLEKAKNASSYNFVQNSSMELYSNNLPTSWTNSSNLDLSGSVDGINTDAQHGSASFKISGDVTKNKKLCQTIPVSGVEEDTYILSAWSKSTTAVPTDDTNVKYQVSIEVHFTDGHYVTKKAADFNPDVIDWQYTSVALNLSDDNKDVVRTPQYIKIYLAYNKQGNTAYFDNIQLIKEPVQSYTYDDEGNMISVVENAQQNSNMQYDDNNNLTQYIDPKGYKYEYTYNDKDRLKTAKTQRGATYTYDYDNRGVVISLTGTTSAGHLIKSTQSVTYPTSTSTEYSVTTTDALNRSVTSTYDAKKGTLKKVEDNQNTVVSTYTYNAYNDLLTSVSQGGATVSYIYDENYKNLSEIETGTSHYYFGYDEYGNRTSVKVGNKILASYTYNANNGPLSQMTYGNGENVAYTYDKYGNVSEKRVNVNADGTGGTLVYEGIADNTGAITKAIDHVNNIQYNYVYDSLGRLVSSTRTDIEDNSRISMFEYAFDLNNNLTKLAVLTANGASATNYTYGKDNQPDTVTFSNGKTLTYNYDSLGRNNRVTVNTTTPISTEYTYHAYSDGTSTYRSNLLYEEKSENFKYRYTYDNRNNIIKIEQGVGEDNNNLTYTTIEEYTYDALNQLTRVDYLTQNKRVVYTYDLGGNITKEKIYTVDSNGTATLSDSKSYVYGDINWKDKLTTYEGQAITYDNIGNPLTYRDGFTFSWSNGRQLQSLTKDGATVNYTYDDAGMRLSKTVDGVEYTYLYQNGLLIQETVGNRILDYSYDANGRLAMVRYRIPANNYDTSFYYALNSRGDVIGLYSATGTLIAKYTYDVWGNVLSVTNATGTEITASTHIANLQSFRYRSYYLDQESNFYYLQSRYYDPVTHRFINADGMISGAGDTVHGYNLFAYCFNSPINLCDPTGAWPKIIDVVLDLVEKALTVKLDVPLYKQGDTNLCWAFCQIMVEDYHAKVCRTQEGAYQKAKELAIENNGAKDWDQGNWPTNCLEYDMFGTPIAATDIHSTIDLYVQIKKRGPIYAYYSDFESAHLILVTGVNMLEGIVYTNNPWGIAGEQTYDQFLSGFAGGTSDGSYPFRYYIYCN